MGSLDFVLCNCSETLYRYCWRVSGIVLCNYVLVGDTVQVLWEGELVLWMLCCVTVLVGDTVYKYCGRVSGIVLCNCSGRRHCISTVEPR